MSGRLNSLLMEPKDYFSLALRIIGFLTLAHGLRDLVDFALLLLNYTNTHSSFSYSSARRAANCEFRLSDEGNYLV
jgi:hypothetical protein